MRRLAAVWVAVLLLFACTPKKAPTEKLVIISPHPKVVLSEFEPVFIAHYKEKFKKDIAIEWLDLGGTSDDLKFIRSEFNKNKNGIQVDLLWGGGATPHVALKKEGLLAPYHPPAEILGAIPASAAGMSIYDTDHQWFGTALSSFGFVCNKKVLRLKNIEPPKTWDDLGKPGFTNLVASADPRHSGSTHTMYAVILQAYGWEKGWDVLLRMGANVKQFIQSSTGILKSVELGDAVCGLSIDYYAWAKIADLGEENMMFVLPQGLTILNPDGISMLKGAPNAQAAGEFINFVLSERGQVLWMLPKGAPQGPTKETIGRMSVLPSVHEKLKGKSPVTVNPFQIKDYILYNEDEADKLWALVNDMAGALIIDPKAQLSEAWSAATKNAGADPGTLALFGGVPISREKALEFAPKWKDEVFRNRIINEWQAFNRQKFTKIRKSEP